MIKTTKKQFALFKKTCLEYQEKWGLHDWDLFFAHIEYDNSYARINAQAKYSIVTIGFTKTWDDEIRGISDKEIRKIAKHEMLHLLLERLEYVAMSRWTIEDALDVCVEALVTQLEKIVQ